MSLAGCSGALVPCGTSRQTIRVCVTSFSPPETLTIQATTHQLDI